MSEELTIPADIAAMPFEKALEELEQLTAKLENGNLPLNQMIELFERGKLLGLYCRQCLNSLERRIEVLANDDGASGQWQDFQPADPR